MDLAAQVKELLDWHLDGYLTGTDDCGCTDEERYEWHARSGVIGDQAYIEHIRDKIMELIECQ